MTAPESVDPETRAREQVVRARRALPGLDPAVYDTFLGWITQHIAPTTEADPIGILASLVSVAGVHLGGGPHVRAGDDAHPFLVWPLIIGRTGGGRKGAGWGSAKRILAATDQEFMTVNVRSGLTSGEGLAAMFAEDTDDGADTFAGSPAKRNPGALPPGDKRLVVFEAEWAGVMSRMKREGNSLSPTLRAAWEGGDLSALTVNARIARDTHVGIVAHITPKEFRSKISASDLAGGTYNRFLPIAVAQCQFLPFSQGADPTLISSLAGELRDRLALGSALGTLGFTAPAAALWRSLYIELGGDHGDAEGGPVEEFSSRAAPNCLRIAGIHAAMDGCADIDVAHLTAAAALVRYSIASARAVFTDTATLSKLAAWIGMVGDTGRTRTEITGGYFKGNTPTDQIDHLLDQLVTAGQITVTERGRADGKPGRRSKVYTATRPDPPTN